MVRQERTLRIIAGQWRGRKFRFPQADIRPTPDRVRETLFNWLQSRIEGARCLDLYAGSGALGLEALSRGAASVVFIERERVAAEAVRDVLQEWQAVGGNVLCQSAQQFLAGVPGVKPFDVVFIDPPFADSRGGELLGALRALAKGWLARDARLYVERAKIDPPLALGEAWRELRTGTAGEVRYHLLARTSEGGPSSP